MEEIEREKLLDFTQADILKATEVGTWLIRLNPEGGRNEMYADSTMLHILDAPADLSPQECYEHWYSRIGQEYYDYVNQSVENMVRTGRIVQLQYTWHHPAMGEVRVRCTGVRRENGNDGMICIVGYHRLVDNMDETSFLQEELSSIEMENQRIRDFYHASLSEAFAYAELDLEKGQLQAAGGLWAECPSRFKGKARAFLQFLVECQHQYSPAPNARHMFITCENVDEMYQKMLHTERGVIRYVYKRLVIRDWRWVQLIIYTFKEKYTHNMYALLYLKDIDAEKKQQEAAQMDPLTGVYNRKAFEDKVMQHMSDREKGCQGAIVLLDVDNFKSVNDQYGHLAGDDVLKHMASCMKNVFSDIGTVGRFGGDEFFILIEADYDRPQINQYMDRFIDNFIHWASIPTSCSAGIAFIRDGAPSYQKILSLADEALYRSKQNGKNQYNYAEEKA